MKNNNSIDRLLTMMVELREKCPWDREQTFASLRGNTIEEVYELTEAIDLDDMESLREELGDVLLHVVFYSHLAAERGAFQFDDVIENLCDKLEYRHPHIYGDVDANTTEEVKRNWEMLKLRKKSKRKGVLGGVPTAMPAMVKALRLGAKAASVGFDWEKREDVWSKVDEELLEVHAEVKSGNQDALEGEFGDLLFAVINASRLYGVDPEAALERTNRKFISRFNQMEQYAEELSTPLTELTIEQQEDLWRRAKSNE